MYKYIYLILKKRLAEITELKDINWYMNQDKVKGGFKTLPGAYINILNTPTKSLGNKIQEATVKFEVILFTDHVSDQDKFVSDTSPINHFDIGDKIHAKLSGFSGLLSFLPAFAALANTANDYKIFNSIDRTEIDTKNDGKAAFKTTQTFSCYAKDYSAERTFIAATATLEIEEFDI